MWIHMKLKQTIVVIPVHGHKIINPDKALIS